MDLSYLISDFLLATCQESIRLSHISVAKMSLVYILQCIDNFFAVHLKCIVLDYVKHVILLSKPYYAVQFKF